MKVLDLPDEQDNQIRQILLKQDDSTLEELAKKSKKELQSFLIDIRKHDLSVEKIQTVVVENKESKILDNELKTKDIESRGAEEKFSKLKSAFPKSILDKNSKIAEMLQDADALDTIKETNAKKEKIEEIIKFLKQP